MADTSRRIWLAGADTEVGQILTSELLAAGHRLALTAPAQAGLLPFAERYPAQTLLLTGDIRDGEQLKTMADRINLEWGALDMAILDLDSASTDQHSEMLAAALYVQEALVLLRRGRDAHLVGIIAPSSPKPPLARLFDALCADLADEPVEIHVAQVSRTGARPATIQHPLTRVDQKPAVFMNTSPRRNPAELGPGGLQDVLSSPSRWAFDPRTNPLHPSKKDR